MATATAAPKTKTEYAALWRKAKAAGEAAAKAAKPTPMIVGTPTTFFGSDIDPTKQTYYVPQGVCGFAWVNFAGNTGFGRWTAKKGIGYKAYGGGRSVSASSIGGQSMEIKAAWAGAVAAVLTAGGVKAYGESRMD